MADPITDLLTEINKILELVEEIGVLAQIGVSLGLTLFALLFSRYIVRRAAWRVVKQTEAEWDND